MRKKIVTLASACLLVASSGMLPLIAHADLEWKTLQNVDLKVTPLDVAHSVDGQRLFILTPGKILVYSLPEGKIVDEIGVDKEFDRITALPKANILTISSKSKKNLQVVMLENIYKVDVSGLPFRGPKDAPVTIAVFDDYQ